LGGLVASALRKKAAPPLPGLDLLAPPPAKTGGPSSEDIQARGQALMACLNDFDIQSELVRITPGPVVTMYEVRPAPGIRVSRIANLSDDLALALKAVAIRIQAPIPGSDTVGIEIPNEQRETVNFRELAASEAFRNGCGPLTMILGKDIAGKPFMADLARMPHLLVAGATGAGKSVCLNGILVSLLYRTQPQDMQLLLIDPKRIEMAVYADAPHLVHPVVTEMNEAKNALDWAVHEMDRRYAAMARLGVRNVSGFNQKLAAYKDGLPPDFSDLEPLPYLVVVIDELADLMMTAAREVETSIVRLAQLARAAGIHMILATQRPSVDVVTGLIKANFPCRISFQVTSKHDSRTILDQVGAEHLLGRGDMLFKPSGGRLQRLHGPFLSDEEVQNVVNHWKRQLSPSYKVDFAQWGIDAAVGGNGSGGGDAAQDPLYGEVQAFVSEQGRASISLVQRRFKIGFNRAARLVEQLEHDGIIGPADGSKPRAVVK
ncbi:DNA translocase FtsK, partial [Desulfovibrio sp. 1188_IL3213]